MTYGCFPHGDTYVFRMVTLPMFSAWRHYVCFHNGDTMFGDTMYVFSTVTLRMFSEWRHYVSFQNGDTAYVFRMVTICLVTLRMFSACWRHVCFQNGDTAAYCAARYGHLEILQYLHEHGAKMDYRNKVKLLTNLVVLRKKCSLVRIVSSVSVKSKELIWWSWSVLVSIGQLSWLQ